MKGVRKLSLFSSEARSLLTDPLLSIDGITFQILEQGSRDSEPKVEEEEESLGTASAAAHCNSCHVTFTDRGEQVKREERQTVLMSLHICRWNITSWIGTVTISKGN